LPAEVWHAIFGNCPPKTLGSLLLVCRLFNVYLDPSSTIQCERPLPLSRSSLPILKPNAIWQASRRRFWPGMPSPLQDKTELYMWQLSLPSSCQHCGATPGASQGAGGDPDPWQSGPGRDGVAIIWAFATRSCGTCLLSKSVKEIDILLSSSTPSTLMAALPFMFVTQGLQAVTPAVVEKGQPPGIGPLTKLYWSSHVDDLKQEFFSVKAMGPATAEEWLKGLNGRGLERRNDALRWEKWASTTEGLGLMRSILYPGNRPPAVASLGNARRERENAARTQKELSEKRNSSVTTKEARETDDADWDEVQRPVRARIAGFADEIIRDGWEDGDKVNTDTCPKFAVEVLTYIRKRFYAEVAKDAAVARAAGKSPKLTLENMKWIFEMKVKPHTERYRKEIFLCNGCEVTVRYYGFEGVIQHYAAKHTHALSIGNVVVHWRAEWPEHPPFTWERKPAKTSFYPGQPPGTNGYQPLGPPQQYQSIAHTTHLEEMARMARELWNATSNMKDTLSIVRVQVVIYHLAKRFHAKFASPLPLSTFIDGLSNHKDMRPVRNVNGLICRVCHQGIGGYVVPEEERKSWSLPQLTSHFQSRHVEHFMQLGQYGQPPEWTVEMVMLPEPAAVSNLRAAIGTDGLKYHLVNEAVPHLLEASGAPQAAAP
ncbi:hypothetical protein M406DRAFT_236131, partial [Cryphonectria parasitica EP155]